MLSVSAPPIAMNRLKHDCFPGDYPRSVLMEVCEPTIIDSKLRPIVRELELDKVKSLWVEKSEERPPAQQPSRSSSNEAPPPPSNEEQCLSSLKSPLRRSSSLPNLGYQKSNLGRRSIFGNYWDKQSKFEDPKLSNPGIPTVPPSLASVATMVFPDGVDWHHFSPPPAPPGPIRHVPLIGKSSQLPPVKSRSASDGFSMSISTICYANADVCSRPAASAMVTLPAPRGGVYPLCSPRSILRRRAETRYTSDPTHMLRFLEEEAKHRRDGSESSDLPFALTKSIKQLQRKQVPGLEDEDDEETESSYSSSSRRVQFNPIVLVTEFEENGKRQWFTERELQRFQHDAIAKARAFLHTRPKMAEDYNKLKLCSVTGTMRKKALFSLPVLSSIVEDCLPKVFSSEFQKMLEREIRSVLIVDPNKTVRDLFCRCLHSLFPWARILGAPSGEEALKVIQNGLTNTVCDASGNCNAIDLVIVAEKLSRCRLASSPAIGTAPSHALGTTAMTSRNTRENGEPASAPLVNNHPRLPSGMTSYELLQRICDLEGEVLGQQRDLVPESPESSSVRRPLLIAVALNLAKDADTLKVSGADVVWGIPPPAPCITMRNHLAFALVSKRHFCDERVES